MTTVKIVSTMENKAAQKKAIHNTSSTVFLVAFNPREGLDSEVTLLNHFIIKRGISDVIATVNIHQLDGTLLDSFKLRMDENRAYSFTIGDYVSHTFIGSAYIFFESNENLAVPFCAVMCSIKSSKSVCGVHTYGRRLEKKELGGSLDLKHTVETGWTARDSKTIKSFAALHGGEFDMDLSVELEISNFSNEIITIHKKFNLKSFATLLIIPQDLSQDIVSHLSGKKGHIKVHIKGLRGIFPRMLCGNYLTKNTESGNLQEANEIQFTHTNFDFSTIEQPDASSNIGYYNQPSLPKGYALVYPVETKKTISIGQEIYNSNSIHYIAAQGMSQTAIKANEGNLPSRFVAAAISTWKGASLESECSTGIITEDKLRIPCHWHWGLLRPGYEDGDSIISIILNRFNRNGDLTRKLKLRLFDEKTLITEKEIIINRDIEIKSIDLLVNITTKGAIWYVLDGEKLEDLNIYSTFSPKSKAGFVEHAF